MPKFNKKPVDSAEIDTGAMTSAEDLPHYDIHKGDAAADPPHGMFMRFVVDKTPGAAAVNVSAADLLEAEAETPGSGVTQAQLDGVYDVLAAALEHALANDDRYTS